MFVYESNEDESVDMLKGLDNYAAFLISIRIDLSNVKFYLEGNK